MGNNNKCDGAVSQNNPVRCRVCGAEVKTGRAKTCSAACRKKKSRRTTDNEDRVLDIRLKLRKVSQSFRMESISEEEMLAYIDFVERELQQMKREVKLKGVARR